MPRTSAAAKKTTIKTTRTPGAASPPPGPRSPGAPRRLGVVTAATAALNFSFGAIVPVLPQYALGLDLGSSSVGLVLAAPALARVCLNSPVVNWRTVAGDGR